MTFKGCFLFSFLGLFAIEDAGRNCQRKFVFSSFVLSEVMRFSPVDLQWQTDWLADNLICCEFGRCYTSPLLSKDATLQQDTLLRL